MTLLRTARLCAETAASSWARVTEMTRPRSDLPKLPSGILARAVPVATTAPSAATEFDRPDRAALRVEHRHAGADVGRGGDAHRRRLGQGAGWACAVAAGCWAGWVAGAGWVCAVAAGCWAGWVAGAGWVAALSAGCWAGAIVVGAACGLGGDLSLGLYRLRLGRGLAAWASAATSVWVV